MPVETSPQMTALFVGLIAVAAASVYLADERDAEGPGLGRHDAD
jgi:hypothetical protein